MRKYHKKYYAKNKEEIKRKKKEDYIKKPKIERRLKLRMVICWKCGNEFMGVNKRGCCYDCIEQKIKLKKEQLKK